MPPGLRSRIILKKRSLFRRRSCAGKWAHGQPGWIERSARSNRGNYCAERRIRTIRRGSCASGVQTARRRRAAHAWLGLAFLRIAKLFQPHQTHRLPQSCRSGRPRHRRTLPVAIPRRTDRRTRAELAHAKRNHRGCHRGIGHGRNRFHHDRSRAPARAAGRRELWTGRRYSLRHRISHQSGARCTSAATPRFADQNTRAHL